MQSSEQNQRNALLRNRQTGSWGTTLHASGGAERKGAMQDFKIGDTVLVNITGVWARGTIVNARVFRGEWVCSITPDNEDAVPAGYVSARARELRDGTIRSVSQARHEANEAPRKPARKLPRISA